MRAVAAAPSLPVSVVVLTFEQARLTSRLLECLAGQRHAPAFEVVVTDDGSSDDTLRAVAEVAGKHALDVRYVWQPDASFRAAHARNNAVRCARGELLLFLDGDLWVGPDLVAGHVAAHAAAEAPEKLVVCATRRHVDLADADAGDPAGWRARSRAAETEAQRGFAAGPHPWMAMIGFGFSVKRRPEVVFDEQMSGWGSEDRELALRLFLDGYAFRCPAELDDVLHFTAPERLTHERLAQAIRNKLYLRSRYAPADVAPALEVMRRWHLDPATDRWSAGKPRDGALEEIVAEARAWLAAH